MFRSEITPRPPLDDAHTVGFSIKESSDVVLSDRTTKSVNRVRQLRADVGDYARGHTCARSRANVGLWHQTQPTSPGAVAMQRCPIRNVTRFDARGATRRDSRKPDTPDPSINSERAPAGKPMCHLSPLQGLRVRGEPPPSVSAAVMWVGHNVGYFCTPTAAFSIPSGPAS